MPRSYPHSHVCHGLLVGFSVKKRSNEPTYFVYFRAKDGRRLERDTNQTGMLRAVEAARAIIEAEYAPAPVRQGAVTWEEAKARLKGRMATSGNRPSTLGYYLKILRLVRIAHAAANGPADISPGMAAGLRDQLMSRPSRRGKPTSAHYVAGVLGGLSALWQKWFMDDLHIVAGNPWQDVTPPKTDRLPVKCATDEMIEHFYDWIAGRFGDWEFPKLFLATKAYTGCRLMDLCALTSGQLQDGRIVFPPDLTKGRKERRVPLRPDLGASLESFKGTTYLWEQYLPGLRAALKQKGWPTHQLNPVFDPKRLYFWIETLFADYRTAFRDRPSLTTHMFRKRAFTRAWEAGIDPRRAAIAYGCNVDTLMRHYVAMDEQEVTDDVFGQLG